MFNPGEKIKTINGNIGWVNSRIHCVGYFYYSIWDGKDGFQNMDEWMVNPYDEKKVGFSEERSSVKRKRREVTQEEIDKALSAPF